MGALRTLLREAWQGIVVAGADAASRTRLPLRPSTALLRREWVVGEAFGAAVARASVLGEGAASLPDDHGWLAAWPCIEALLL